MVPKSLVGGGRRQVIISAVVTASLLGGGLVGRCIGSVPVGAIFGAHVVGFNQPQLVFLKPGLKLGKKPPKGWSHFVIKSLPRLATGDQASLPAGSSKTATLFRSVILANVKPMDVEEKDFELAQIGVGLCVPYPQDEDQDIVVSADQLDALGLNLTMVQKVVLDTAEAEMAEGRIVARTPTFALFRSPVTVVDTANKHRKVNLYYAFCVERTTGRLRIGVWTMRPESESQQAPATMVKLASDPIFKCELDVRARRILGTVPYSWSFAMRTLPPGKELRVPPALGALMVQTTRHPAESDIDELERLVMKVLSTVPDPQIVDDNTAAPKTDSTIRRTAIPPPYRRVQ
jgi:hypothetical protein